MATVPIYPYRIRVRVTSKWKQPVKQPDGSIKLHNGVDHGTVDLKKSGKKIDRHNFAMLDGEITDVSNLKTLGWAYKIYYPEIKETYYGVHLEEVIVKKGQKVRRGQTLAITGKAKGQTIAEHTHIQSRKGKETGGLYHVTIDGKSVNPEGLLAKSKLKSELVTIPTPDPKPPVIPPPTEPEVCLPQSIYQNLLQKELDDARAIKALNSLVSSKNIEIGEKDQTIVNLQTERDTANDHINDISSIFGVEYEPLDNWDVQKYKYIAAIDEIKNQSLEKAEIRQLLAAIINKIKGKVK